MPENALIEDLAGVRGALLADGFAIDGAEAGRGFGDGLGFTRGGDGNGEGGVHMDGERGKAGASRGDGERNAGGHHEIFPIDREYGHCARSARGVGTRVSIRPVAARAPGGAARAWARRARAA